MEVEITWLPDGSVRLRVPGDAAETFPQARAKLEALVNDLGMAGIKVAFDGKVEEHNHGPEQVRLGTHVH